MHLPEPKEKPTHEALRHPQEEGGAAYVSVRPLRVSYVLGELSPITPQDDAYKTIGNRLEEVQRV